MSLVIHAQLSNPRARWYDNIRRELVFTHDIVEDAMKIRLILALALLFLVSSCATVKPATATEADSAAAYMHEVENAAFGRAAQIIWVNPPRSEDLENNGEN